MELNERKREIDLNILDTDQIELVGSQIGEKIGQIGDEAAAKINEIMKIYGIAAKVAIQFTDIKTGQILS